MSQTIRKLQATFQAKGTLEGAGVKLHRGFLWHPHRGIETVTYVLDGEVDHQDSLGHAGTISNGAVQWMSASIKVIAGNITLGEHTPPDIIQQAGPVHDITAQPLFIDIQLQANRSVDIPVVSGHTVFLYVFEGNLGLDDSGVVNTPTRQILLLEPTGDTVHIKAGSSGARFLLVSGKPLNEPIAWNGPIVMNTAEELELAFEQLQSGEFIS